ncbi:glycosyltransferase family 4 protein [Subsaxibacter sp. CAU 1640]|uniref:glycosyltransferase family 4 protein n=1 Tax=Subsaxibacter sp. CAU 1640 TaxID=2933271 RepID=UPI002006D87D|nr:glycosyltransferase family 4 protein [Subsaxibacter sp. CAU 1640]MCK7589904.1 glycosyltransferase family 4 protein [Subsaxibacter sp. CAU 1640]
MNIAIFSPNKNPYSETFIRAHKRYLENTVFYYGKRGNIKIEGEQSIVPKSTKNYYRFWFRLFKSGKITLNEKLILKSLKEKKINVILVEYGTHAHSLINLLHQSQLPFVVHFHGYDASNFNVLEKCNNYKQVFLLAKKIVVVSKAMKQNLINIGCPNENLVYNVYGPRPEFIEVQPKYLKKQFLSVGRFTDKKAPYYTILAFEKVLKIHSDARLIMAGDGELLETCKNLVSYLDLSEKVVFLGVISEDRYRELLSESLAYVQHSITSHTGDMEGTPLSILEASYAGLPVIATYHAGIPDVIIHNKTGLLCKEHDVETMANHMIKLSDDINLAKDMGNEGKLNIMANFSLKRHIDSLQNTLKSCI